MSGHGDRKDHDTRTFYEEVRKDRRSDWKIPRGHVRPVVNLKTRSVEEVRVKWVSISVFGYSRESSYGTHN